MFLRDFDRYDKDVDDTSISQFKESSTFLVDASDVKAIEFFESKGYKYKIYHALSDSVQSYNQEKNKPYTETKQDREEYEEIKGISDYFLGVGRGNSITAKQMREFVLNGKSLSEDKNGRFFVNAEKMTDNDIDVYVAIGNEAMPDDVAKIKGAIKTILDSGGRIIMKNSDALSRQGLDKEKELVEWIKNEFNIEPDESQGSYTIFEQENKKLEFKPQESKEGLHGSENQIFTLEESEDNNGKVYRLSRQSNKPFTIKDVEKHIDKMDVGSRFVVGDKADANTLEMVAFIRNNPSLMLYKIHVSERKVKLDKEARKVAKMLGLKYDKETKEISLYDYSVLKKDVEIIKEKQYGQLMNNEIIKPSEMIGLSKLSIFMFSNVISRLQKDNSFAKQIAETLGKDQDQYDNIDFSKESRIGIINKIGIQNLFEYIRIKYFTNQNENYAKFSMKKKRKLKIISDNFQAFIELGSA